MSVTFVKRGVRRHQLLLLYLLSPRENRNAAYSLYGVSSRTAFLKSFRKKLHHDSETEHVHVPSPIPSPETSPPPKRKSPVPIPTPSPPPSPSPSPELPSPLPSPIPPSPKPKRPRRRPTPKPEFIPSPSPVTPSPSPPPPAPISPIPSSPPHPSRPPIEPIPSPPLSPLPSPRGGVLSAEEIDIHLFDRAEVAVRHWFTHASKVMGFETLADWEFTGSLSVIDGELAQLLSLHEMRPEVLPYPAHAYMALITDEVLSEDPKSWVGVVLYLRAAWSEVHVRFVWLNPKRNYRKNEASMTPTLIMNTVLEPIRKDVGDEELLLKADFVEDSETLNERPDMIALRMKIPSVMPPHAHPRIHYRMPEICMALYNMMSQSERAAIITKLQSRIPRFGDYDAAKFKLTVSAMIEFMSSASRAIALAGMRPRLYEALLADERIPDDDLVMLMGDGTKETSFKLMRGEEYYERLLNVYLPSNKANSCFFNSLLVPMFFLSTAYLPLLTTSVESATQPCPKWSENVRWLYDPKNHPPTRKPGQSESEYRRRVIDDENRRVRLRNKMKLDLLPASEFFTGTSSNETASKVMLRKDGYDFAKAVQQRLLRSYVIPIHHYPRTPSGIRSVTECSLRLRTFIALCNEHLREADTPIPGEQGSPELLQNIIVGLGMEEQYSLWYLQVRVLSMDGIEISSIPTLQSELIPKIQSEAPRGRELTTQAAFPSEEEPSPYNPNSAVIEELRAAGLPPETVRILYEQLDERKRLQKELATYAYNTPAWKQMKNKKDAIESSHKHIRQALRRSYIYCPPVIGVIADIRAQRFGGVAQKRTDISITPQPTITVRGENENWNYQLTAIIVHQSSSVQGGHYVAYFKDPSSVFKGWFYYNDIPTEPNSSGVKLTRVIWDPYNATPHRPSMSQYYDTQNILKNAYMYLYERSYPIKPRTFAEDPAKLFPV